MKIYNVIRTALFLALTALVFVFIGEIAEIECLRYFIGSLMIFYGVEEILFTFFESKKHYNLKTLYWNLIEIVIGITLIVFVETGDIEVTYAIVCVAWATWSILRETRELLEGTEEIIKRQSVLHIVLAIVNILESFAVIALSLWMLIEPGEHHAKIHLYMLTVELITKVLLPDITMAFEYFENRHNKIDEMKETEMPEAAVAEDGEE